MSRRWQCQAVSEREARPEANKSNAACQGFRQQLSIIPQKQPAGGESTRAWKEVLRHLQISTAQKNRRQSGSLRISPSASADRHGCLLLQSATQEIRPWDRDSNRLLSEHSRKRMKRVDAHVSCFLGTALPNRPSDYFSSSSAICTALRAAPLSNWSPTTQKHSPLSNAQSWRIRPTWQL